MKEYGRQGANGHDYSQGISENGIFNGIMPWMQSLWDDIFGYNSQMREFEQQEYLLEKEQDWSSEQSRMQRMRQAGINPMVAAAGIAGTSISPTAPQVSSSGAQGAAAIGSIASLLSSVTNAPQSLASAKETQELLNYRKSLISSETVKNLEDAGLSHWNALSIATLLPEQQANLQADLYLKVAQYDKINAEYFKINAEHDKILSEIELNTLQLSNMEKQGKVLDEEARWKKLENDFFESYGFKSDNPLDVSLRNSIVSGKKEQAEAIGNGVENYHYMFSHGENRGLAEYSYQIENARRNGQNASDVAYNRVGGMADYAGRLVYHGKALIDGGVEKISNLFKHNDVKQVRQELSMVLNNAYEALELYPGDAEHYNKVIEDTNALLQLSNKELLKWYEQSK